MPMLKDSLTVELKHKRFVKEVAKNKTVYVLENDVGLTSSNSVHFEDEDDEPVGLVCFWFNAALTKSCTREGWPEYELAELKLTEFMGNWCIGMENDGLMIGTDFDSKMFGFEAEPLELVLDIIEELKLRSKSLDFVKFDGLIDF